VLWRGGGGRSKSGLPFDFSFLAFFPFRSLLSSHSLSRELSSLSSVSMLAGGMWHARDAVWG